MSYIFTHSSKQFYPVFTGVSARFVDKSCPIIYTMLTRIQCGLHGVILNILSSRTLSKLSDFFNHFFHKFLICSLLNPSPTMPP